MRTKYKITNKKGRKLLIVKSEKGQTLNKREVNEIQNCSMQGVLPIEVEIKRKGFLIIYDLTSYIPLNQYISTIVNKKKFAEIVLQILGIFQQLTDQYYKTQNLVLDLEKIVVNPSTDQIYFPFVPILYYDFGITEKEFLIQLIYSTTFDNTEDTSYIDHCLYILQKNMNFSRVELEEYLKSQIDDESSTKRKVKSDDIQDIYDPSEQWDQKEEIEKPTFKKNIEQVKPEKEKEKKEKEPAQSSELTGSLTDFGDGGTMLLGALEESYLRQERTGQKFYLKLDEITIGKRQDNHVCISDNPVVSRTHAKLVRIQNDYYLQEVKATNGTKVNGRRIQPTEQVLLRDGDMVEFANEKFIYYK